MPTVERTGAVLTALIKEEFEPMIRCEINRIKRHVMDTAQAQIEREVRELAIDVNSSIARLADEFKTHVQFDYTITIPKEWEDKCPSR